MGYDCVIIDSITCDSYIKVMYEGENPTRKPLLDLQTKSANLIADEEEGLLCITSETKELIERKYVNDNMPMSLSCLLGAREEINIFSKDENDSIGFDSNDSYGNRV